MALRSRSVVWVNAFGLVVVAACLSGCGGKRFHPRAAVSGKVTLGSKPLPGGMITFSREDDPRDVDTAYIRSDGTYETKGAPVGKCKVAVRTAHLNPITTPAKPGDPPPPPPKPPEYYVQLSGDPKTGKVYVPIPAKYEDLSSSGLTFEVKSGDNTYDIPLAEK